MKYLLLVICFLILLSGCNVVETLGGVSSETFNKSMTEIQEFSKEALTNQGQLGEIVINLANEDLLDARKDDDESKLERSIKNITLAEISVKKSNELAKTEFTKANSSSFDLNGIVGYILAILAGVFPSMGVVYGVYTKLQRVKEKGKIFANSTEVNDISNDKDFK